MSSRTQRNGRPEGHKSIGARIRQIDYWRLEEGDGFEAIASGDTVIDALGDGLQRLYFVTKDLMDEAAAKIQRLTDDVRTLSVEHDNLRRMGFATSSLSTLTQNRVCELKQQIAKQRQAYETAHDLFWNSVRIEYPAALEANALVIREGWVLVSTPVSASQDGASLNALLETFFGDTPYGNGLADLGDLMIVSVGGPMARS